MAITGLEARGNEPSEAGGIERQWHYQSIVTDVFTEETLDRPKEKSFARTFFLKKPHEVVL